MDRTFPPSFDTAQSRSLLAELARPTGKYRRHAWFAMAGLVLFMAAYAGLTAWFLFTAFRAFELMAFGKGGLVAALLCAGSLFFAFFMIKAVFFIKRGRTGKTVEVTAAEQPRLFDFLNRLADTAGAPRPHRVFVSATVNACVFYDLSLVNLIFPSRKNLEIGLGLVNVLSFGEFRAVLAHEFGHFAQSAMAVGRWVYVVQQIAGHLVMRRDRLDRFLRSLSRSDPRVAWVGWIISAVLWAIRSLVDSAFTLVVMLQRALSREMEFQADLVAVAIAGSDAPVHALHRLQGADDSWDRALHFAQEERGKGRTPRDVFALQSRILDRMGALLHDPIYAPAPAVPTNAADHRVFSSSFAEPPRMWRTHPLNHEREANAKRRYVAAEIDERSAWDLFDAPEELRERLSAGLFEPADQPTAPIEVSVALVDQSFDSERLNPRYRGIYFGRSITRHVEAPEALCDPGAAADLQAIDALYPPALAAAADRLRSLGKELARLKALESGTLKAESGGMRHRGLAVTRRTLPTLIATVTAEFEAEETLLRDHDRRCRSLHRAAAAALGGGWAAYLDGLLGMLHYMEHTEADLRDAQSVLRTVLSVETAARQVGERGLARILNAANQLHWTLEKVFGDAGAVALDRGLAQRSGIPDWAGKLGQFKLPSATRSNINEWLKVIDGWVDRAAKACGVVRAEGLDLLLLTEAALAEHLRRGTTPDEAPAPSRAPHAYPTLLPGAERERKTRLSAWTRFRTANGWVYGTARLAAAVGIVATVFGVGWSAEMTTLAVYNGLARPVVVQVGAESITVPAFGTSSRRIMPFGAYPIETRSTTGALIDTQTLRDSGADSTLVYNVAAASPLVAWTAAYGPAHAPPPVQLGAPAVLPSLADFLFTDPPHSLKSDKGGTTRRVLSGMGGQPPQSLLASLPDGAERQRITRVHARWDETGARHTLTWLWLAAAGDPGFGAILDERLAETPADVMLRRMAQDTAPAAAKPARCAADAAGADAAPDNADLRYLALRCLADSPAKDRGFIEAQQRWPENGWLALGAGYAEAGNGRWPAALTLFDTARRALPGMRPVVAMQIARLSRVLDRAGAPDLTVLAQESDELGLMTAIESATALDTPALKAYGALAKGQIASALDLAHGDPASEARLIRLAAASDGADAALVARAAALEPAAGLDASTLWPTIGLAARAHQDYSAYLKQLPEIWTDRYKFLPDFVKGLQSGQRPEALEKLLAGLEPELRGHAYVVGVIVLGPRAPQAWRDGAKRLLFSFERPYFS
jgi:Zn-dependent protease with chaperone function